MESHHIHVDKEALKRTSELLGVSHFMASVFLNFHFIVFKKKQFCNMSKVLKWQLVEEVNLSLTSRGEMLISPQTTTVEEELHEQVYSTFSAPCC